MSQTGFGVSKGRAITAVVVGAVAALAVDRFAALAIARQSVRYAADKFLSPAAQPAFSTDALPLALAFAAFAIIVLAFFSAAVSGTFRRGEEHGSARFSTAKEMRAFADADEPLDNVILADGISLRVSRNPNFEFDRNRNVLVVGGSGSGKTRGYVKPNLMQVACKENAGKLPVEEAAERYARSYVVTDPKGTTCTETAHVFAANGIPVKQFNTIDFSASVSYNPIAYIKSEDDVMSFATCLIENTTGDKQHSGDPFWENAEKLLYQALINYMLTEVAPEDRNLVTLSRLLDLGKVEESGTLSGLDILFLEVERGLRFDPDAAAAAPAQGASMKSGAAVAASPWREVGEPRPNHPGVLAYNDYKSGAPETLQSILISAKVRLAPLRTKGLQRILATDSLDLGSFAERPQALYLVFDAQDPTYNFLHALLIWQMMNELKRRSTVLYKDRGGALPVGVDFLLDEAAQFYVPNLEKTIAVVRSMNIGITVILQSLSQLDARYDKSAETIIDCCDTLLFLGGKSDKTNESLEKQMGQQTVTTDNESKTHADRGSWSEQEAQHGRALMFASEIGKMPQSECLVIIRGASPYKGKKADPTKHPCYRYIDCPHEGSAYARPFEFAAYRSNPRYFDAAPEPAASVSAVARLLPIDYRPETKVSEKGYAVMLQVFVKNEGPTELYAAQGIVRFGQAADAGRPAFRADSARSSIAPADGGLPEAMDVLDHWEADGFYVVKPFDLAPGETAALTFPMSAKAEDAVPANGAATFEFPFDADFSFANADKASASGEIAVAVDSNGTASASAPEGGAKVL